MSTSYPPEILDEYEDDGTMPANVEQLTKAVVGHRIVSAGKRKVTGRYNREYEVFGITLDDGTEVRLADSSDCCAYTELEAFLLHPEKVNHVIMGVGTTDEFARWHIYADHGDILELTVGWSPGNIGYYGYGFSIDVVDPA